MRCNEVQLNYVNWTVWHDLFTYAQNYFQCWTFQYVFSHWSKIDFFSGHSKLLFMYISIQLKIPIMIKLFLVIQWKRQCHLDKVFYDENSISYAVMH